MGQRMTPAEHIAILRAELARRYGFQARPDRADEMEIPGTPIGISVAYGCFAVRVQMIHGRQRAANTFQYNVGDFRLNSLWRAIEIFRESSANLLRSSH